MSSSPKKIALIGGITGGIGSSLASKLAAQQWTVYGFSRNSAKVESAEKVFSADATKPDEIKSVVEQLIKTEGALHSYFHCIGSIFLKPGHLTSPEELSGVLETNLLSAFYALSCMVPVLLKNENGGSMTFCSTTAVGCGLANHEAIAAAKGGLEGMVRAAAATNASRGIRVNAVAPGLVDTPAAKSLLGSDPARKASAAMHPLGRIGQPAEVASLLAWLASEDAGWVTGQIWNIDGGLAHLRAKPRA